MKIKIILVTDCLEDLAGGAEKQIFELAKHLDKTRFDVTIASLECVGKAPRDLIESVGCQLATFPVKRIYGLSGLIQGIRFLKYLHGPGALGRWGADKTIVMTYHFSSDMWGTFWGRLAGVPVIMSNRRDMGFWRKPWHVWAYRLMNPWVNKVIVNANAIKEKFMAEERLPPGKVEVIYNGIETQDTRKSPFTIHYSPLTCSKEELGIKEDDIVIMHVANLRPVKGHEYLLRVFSQLVSTNFNKFPSVPNLKLILIGDGALRQDLEQLAGSLGLWPAHPASAGGRGLANFVGGDSGTYSKAQVIFLGKRNDVRDLLNMADICVLPSLSEGMSNAILEYMAAGKPVIATNVGGNPELIRDGFNGILVEAANTDQLAGALARLINSPEDRLEMGKRGLAIVKEHFSAAEMIKKYESVFQELY